MKSGVYIALAAAAGAVFLLKRGGATKPKFYMAARFMPDGRLYPGGDQCYSIDQNAWVAKSFCGR